MTNKELLDKLQEKITKIHNEADESLKNLGEREGEKHKNVKNMWDCDVPYYRDVARHAWALRAKKIAMIEMQAFINYLRKELES
jgi:hypothetical protein